MGSYAKPLPDKVTQLVDESKEDEPVAAASDLRKVDVAGEDGQDGGSAKGATAISTLRLQSYLWPEEDWMDKDCNCCNCRGEGHPSKECPFPKPTWQQKNRNPSMV